MVVPLLFLLQTVPPPEGPVAAPARVDLPAPWRPAACSKPQAGDDIVVCGSRDLAERYRVRTLPPKYAEVAGPGIGADLGKGMRGNLYTTTGGTIDGKVSNRIMFKVTMPF